MIPKYTAAFYTSILFLAITLGGGVKAQSAAEILQKSNQITLEGVAKHNAKDFKAAIALFTQSIQLLSKINPPDDAAKFQLTNTYYYRGMSKFALNNTKTKMDQEAIDNLKAAVEDYNQAIKYDPNHAESYNIRGTARHRLEDLNGAMEDFFRAIELKKDYANAYYNRASLYSQLQDDFSALEDYDKAIQYDPQYKEAWNNRGLVKLVIAWELAKKEEYTESEKYYNLGCQDIKKSAELGLKQGQDNIKNFCKDSYLEWRKQTLGH